jgi:predicted unusual protein kinase regulating ubiquinone biosynthesis (AarF/ABC1/UbiB family)
LADDSKVPPTGRFARFRKLASLSAQLGTDVLARGVKRLAGADPKTMSMGTAEKLVATLGDLKGAAMKFGQAISMDAELFTPEVRAVLSRLQNAAPSMPYERVREVVERELGSAPEALYATFEREPMAAASLGQVHRATLADGREVAVKVQYPGIGEALTSDLQNLGTLVRTLSKTSKVLDGRAYYEELKSEMILEVDYRREASLARAFAEAARRLPDLKVPDVVEERTSQRVLTLELLAGPTLKDFMVSAPSAPERFRVARLLIRAIYGPFLVEGEIHSDPHPGNFVVMPDGRLGVLDFGSVKRFSPTFVEVNRRLFKNAIEQRQADVLDVCREVGFSIELPDDEARPLIREVLHTAGRPLRVDEYDYATDEISRDMKTLFRENAASFLRIRPPAEAVMFFRSTGGLSQNLRLLGAKGDFRAVYRELAAL